MPPIARLTPDQAIYHFISGYTCKIAGTEIGLGIEPEITFSTCFGAPFMVHHPYVYAEMLKARDAQARRQLLAGQHRLDRRAVRRRQAHQHPAHPRAAERGAQRASSTTCQYRSDPVFGFEVPKSCEGVPDEHPRPGQYLGQPRGVLSRKYDALAARFIENFKMMDDGCPQHIAQAGPRRANGTSA